MPKSISVTGGNSKQTSRGHNVRDKKIVKEQTHIDHQKSANDIVLLDNQSLPEVYDKLFGAATKEYNSRQKRNDRKIKSYYTKIKNDGQKHLTYELVVQVGNREDTAVSMNPTAEIEALKRYAMEFPSRNPQLYVVGAYIHLDENTPHLHLDYIPVAYNCTSGLRTQNALDRALRQQGFASIRKGKTAQMAFDDAERLALERICLDMGINAKANQGLTKGRGHLSKAEFVAAKDKLNRELEPIRTEAENNLAQSKEVLEGAKSEGKRIVSESKAEGREIIGAAKTAVRELQRASEGQIEDLELKRIDLDLQCQALAHDYEELDADYAELSKKCDRAGEQLVKIENAPPRPTEPTYAPLPYDKWADEYSNRLENFSSGKPFDSKAKREKRRKAAYDKEVADYEQKVKACAEWDSKWGVVGKAEKVLAREHTLDNREMKLKQRENGLNQEIEKAVNKETAKLQGAVNYLVNRLEQNGIEPYPKQHGQGRGR